MLLADVSLQKVILKCEISFCDHATNTPRFGPSQKKVKLNENKEIMKLHCTNRQVKEKAKTSGKTIYLYHTHQPHA